MLAVGASGLLILASVLATKAGIAPGGLPKLGPSA